MSSWSQPKEEDTTVQVAADVVGGEVIVDHSEVRMAVGVPASQQLLLHQSKILDSFPRLVGSRGESNLTESCLNLPASPSPNFLIYELANLMNNDVSVLYFTS